MNIIFRRMLNIYFKFKVKPGYEKINIKDVCVS